MDDSSTAIVGEGRSGVVVRDRHPGSGDVARKMFHCVGLTKLVHYVVFGAPNPYVWCENAVRAAMLRRQILCDLVETWLPHKLRVARALDWQWNDRNGTYELHTEWIDGRHAALRQPFNNGRDDEFHDLRQNVMKPLQHHLAAAGFDGLLWQAGRGNPVALNNFLLRNGPSELWVWIDLESGVPALFPSNPLQLLRFYLPKAWQHGGPLFDDVDIEKLRNYVNAQTSQLAESLGLDRARAMVQRIEALSTCQNRWRAKCRVDRSIQCELRKGRITPSEAKWYSSHSVVWYQREMTRALRRGLMEASLRLGMALRWLARANYWRVLRNVGAFLCSEHFRAQLARTYVSRRIDHWEQRGQLMESEVTLLRDHLDREEAGSYITDFGVHIAMKPIVKATTYLLVPSMVLAGMIGAKWIVITAIFCGAVARTIYTGGRFIQSLRRNRERPWVALLAGTLPMVGNLAYPLQIVYAGTSQNHQLAQFILFDSFSQTGQKLPIWGGCDTLTEHILNRLPAVLIRGRTTHVEFDAKPGLANSR